MLRPYAMDLESPRWIMPHPHDGSGIYMMDHAPFLEIIINQDPDPVGMPVEPPYLSDLPPGRCLHYPE